MKNVCCVQKFTIKQVKTMRVVSQAGPSQRSPDSLSLFQLCAEETICSLNKLELLPVD